MPALTPREVFDRFRQAIVSNSFEEVDNLYADDVVIEWPFHRPGAPGRIEGREQFLAYASAARSQLPGTFEEVRDVVLHETADPEVIVVEFAVAGVIADRPVSARFVQIMRVREGRVLLVREYQDVAGMAAALAA